MTNAAQVSKDEQRTGFIASAGAYALWGFLPLYFKLISFADAREVLGQRILWCAPFAFLAIFAMSGWRGGLNDLRAALRPRMLFMLALSSLFIFFNWGIYVWMVLQNRIIEASLAYFLAPLVSVAVGVVFFRERITTPQIAALALAAAGVIVQGLALGAGPWMALALCATWSIYAVIRKQTQISAATGLFVETTWLLPIAAFLIWRVAQDHTLAFSENPTQALLLAIAGPITAAPLMLFTFGARRVSFTALGLMQFFAPSLQFIIGIVLGEQFTPLRAASFALIWIGLGLFTWDTLRRAPTAKTS